MNYQEFKTTYKKAFKAYPNISELFQDIPTDNICLVNTHYEKSGSKWKETDRKEEMINYVHYLNIVDPCAIQFFRNLGGYERVNKSYTKYGLLPVEIVSINPDRTVKSVYRFSFC